MKLYINEDSLDDRLQDRTFKIPDVPEDYLYDVVEYAKTVGLEKKQFDYDDNTETVIIKYSPYDNLGFEKCSQVQKWVRNILSYKTFEIPDVPEDYLYDVIEYAETVGLDEEQFDYDDSTETLIIAYGPEDSLGFEKCLKVQKWVQDMVYLTGQG